MDQDKIKLFEDQPIRTAWDAIYEEGEPDESSTVREIRKDEIEGSREVRRTVVSNRKKDNALLLGLLFTIVSAVFTIVVSDTYFFNGLRLQPFLFDAGVDSLGALICVALYFGCMTQDGAGKRSRRRLL